MFKDRIEAGQKLAKALTVYKGKDPLVLAVPRGGVSVGYQVARDLRCDFSLIMTRKLPFPDNPEAGFGAIAEDGSTYFINRAFRRLPSEIVEQIVEEQKIEIKRRIETLRRGRPLPAIANRTVVLVDDGIAMGSTMHAAILLCKGRHAATITVAVPVAGPSVAAEFARVVNQVIVLEKPRNFHAVAQVYENWYDVPDEEVTEIMQQFEGIGRRV